MPAPMHNSAKENILKRIRQALSHPTAIPFPGSESAEDLFHPAPDTQELALLFAEQFTQLQGKFAYCASTSELGVQLTHLRKHKQFNKIFCNELAIKQILTELGVVTHNTNLADCDVSITGCEALIARTGSLLMSTAQSSGRTASVYAPIHICIAYVSQLVYDIKDGLQYVKTHHEQLPSLITLASGPSRTADIEKTLVVGVHGPKEVYCFLVDDGV